MTSTFVTIPKYRSEADASDSDTDEGPSKISFPLLEAQSERSIKPTEPEEVTVYLTSMPTNL